MKNDLEKSSEDKARSEWKWNGVADPGLLVGSGSRLIVGYGSKILLKNLAIEIFHAYLGKPQKTVFF